MSLPSGRQPNLLLRFVLGVLGLMALIVFVWVQQEKDATQRTTDRAALQDDANPFIKRTPKPIIAPAPTVMDEARLAREMRKVMEAFVRVGRMDVARFYGGNGLLQEYVKETLAQAMRVNLADLRALLAAGCSSSDALTSGQALLALLKTTEAMAKFEQVIASENGGTERLAQAEEGKDLAERLESKLRASLAGGQAATAYIDKSTEPLIWANAQIDVAQALRDLGENGEAEALYREVLRFQEEQLDLDSCDLGIALRSLAGLLSSTGRPEEAETLLRRNLANIEAEHGANNTEHGPNNILVANALVPLADLLVEMNQPENAEPLALRAVSCICRNQADDPFDDPYIMPALYSYWQVAAALKLSREEIHSRLEAEALSAGVKPADFEKTWQALLKEVPPDPSAPP